MMELFQESERKKKRAVVGIQQYVLELFCGADRTGYNFFFPFQHPNWLVQLVATHDFDTQFVDQISKSKGKTSGQTKKKLALYELSQSGAKHID